MDASLNWLNGCLESEVSAEEADRLLTQAGFPLEEMRPAAGGDVCMDVEITSNRGDCLSHVGLAREISACGGIGLKATKSTGVGRTGDVASALKLDNQEPGVCPRFTAQVIKGVKVGPSPSWLVQLLEAVGQRSINNIVDVTNYLTLHFGQPSHVFDLAKLAGAALVIRYASAGEKLRTLDGKDRALILSDLVVADAERAQSLAGVIGGAESEVSESTTDVVLEVACWDPVTVRTAARRLNIRTDASHRFERGVDPRTLEDPARFAAAMIVELAGGELLGGENDGVLVDGAALPRETVVDLRPSRCSALIGVEYCAEEITTLLGSLNIGVERESDDCLRCTIPAFRLDLTREVDLIEEVARTGGFERIPLSESLPIRVTHPQRSETALREIASTLTGLGFYETVTISFVSPAQAAPFLDEGLRTVGVDDDRRKAEPTLRPSVLPSLLACRKANQDGRAHVPGGLRLFETAAAFAQGTDDMSKEHATLAMLIDVQGVQAGKKAKSEQIQGGIRQMRGAIEAVIRSLAGSGAKVTVARGTPIRSSWNASVFADVSMRGGLIGHMGLIADSVLGEYDLDVPVVCAELKLEPLLALEPARARVSPLPAYPGIERDLSLIVDESVTWDAVRGAVTGAGVDRLVGIDFVGAYRGKQIPSGKKSLTIRLSFRDPQRTLQHDEVDPQVETVLGSLRGEFEAQLRT